MADGMVASPVHRSKGKCAEVLSPLAGEVVVEGGRGYRLNERRPQIVCNESTSRPAPARRLLTASNKVGPLSKEER